jgi:hypothetical protein
MTADDRELDISRSLCAKTRAGERSIQKRGAHGYQTDNQGFHHRNPLHLLGRHYYYTLEIITHRTTIHAAGKIQHLISLLQQSRVNLRATLCNFHNWIILFELPCTSSLEALATSTNCSRSATKPDSVNSTVKERRSKTSPSFWCGCCS